MTADLRAYDRVRFHRGTRGFAAFVTGLNGGVVLGAALFVVPTLGLDSIAASWAVILGVAAGIAHFIAVVGLVRGRRWSARLVGYLAAAGIAVAGFGALVAATGVEVFGADRATAFGFFAWMIGAWAVAASFAFKPFTFTPHAHRVVAAAGVASAVSGTSKPILDGRPLTGLRKRRPATDVRPARRARPLPTPRIVQPVPSRIVLRPISTPTA
jgi:hypothetical protein